MNTITTGNFQFCKIAMKDPRQSLPMTWGIVVELRGEGFGPKRLPGPRVYEGNKIRVWVNNPQRNDPEEIWAETFLDYPSVMTITLATYMEGSQDDNGLWSFDHKELVK